jgi:hypothetical protein
MSFVPKLMDLVAAFMRLIAKLMAFFPERRGFTRSFRAPVAFLMASGPIGMALQAGGHSAGGNGGG